MPLGFWNHDDICQYTQWGPRIMIVSEWDSWVFRNYNHSQTKLHESRFDAYGTLDTARIVSHLFSAHWMRLRFLPNNILARRDSLLALWGLSMSDCWIRDKNGRSRLSKHHVPRVARRLGWDVDKVQAHKVPCPPQISPQYSLVWKQDPHYQPAL